MKSVAGCLILVLSLLPAVGTPGLCLTEYAGGGGRIRVERLERPESGTAASITRTAS